MTPTPVPQKKSYTVFDFSEKETSSESADTLAKEFKEYDSILIDTDLDILASFWKLKERNFPLLSKVAKRLLCARATSSPAERLFSSAGYNIWDRRCSLNPLKINKMMIVNQYEKNIEKLNKNKQ